MRGGTVKLEGYHRKEQPCSKKEIQAYIQLIAEIAMARFHEGKPQFHCRTDAVPLVNDRLKGCFKDNQYHEGLRKLGLWKHPHRGARTIERMVQRSAEPKWYPDKVPKVAAAGDGMYQLNPAKYPELFKGEQTK